MTNIRPAIFLDRDGVINEEPLEYIKSVNEFTFLPGSLVALGLLAQLKCPIVIITNQSSIGRGILSENSLMTIHQFMLQKIQEAGGRIDAIYYCPHHPNDLCECRKPLPGLFKRASQELEIDLSLSYMIGDTEKDLFAAHTAGCFPIFVRSGRAKQLRQIPYKYHVSENLLEAAEWLMTFSELH